MKALTRFKKTTTPTLLFRRALAHKRHEGFSLYVAASTVVAGITLLAVVWPDWLEAFGLAPDGGNGGFEWAVSIVVVGVGLVSLLLRGTSAPTRDDEISLIRELS